MSNFIKASLLFFISLSVAQAKSFEDTYVIGAGDKIQISVYGESDLSIDELYISNSGKFEYPYLGQLSALNKTPESLKNELFSIFVPYFYNKISFSEPFSQILKGSCVISQKGLDGLFSKYLF